MKLNKDGMLDDPAITLKRFETIEHGELKSVHAIVVHQTDTRTEQETFNSYLHPMNTSEATGAHFLIDKNGTIYQTASLNKRCYHVGKYIKSKCLELKRENCANEKNIQNSTIAWTAKKIAIDLAERDKDYPDRFPVNNDSVGIELVGKNTGEKSYQPVTPLQQASLQWLIQELNALFSLKSEDVYRHPEVSYKNPGEAASATWE